MTLPESGPFYNIGHHPWLKRLRDLSDGRIDVNVIDVIDVIDVNDVIDVINVIDIIIDVN